MTVAVIALTVSPVSAGLIIVPGPYMGFTQILQISPMGQTFTAEDSRVQSIGFSVTDMNPTSGPSDFSLTILLYGGAGVFGPFLGARTYSALTPGYTGFIDVGFESVPFVPGATYTAIIADSTPRWGVHGASTNAYLGGDPVYRGVPQVRSADLALRVIPAIPEPSVLVLYGLGGVALLGWQLRRRKRD